MRRVQESSGASGNNGQMRFAFLLVLLLGACSFSGAEGEPDGSGGDGGGGGDDDGMPREADEDGDGIKDALDNCVQTKNAGQEDGDDDKVGDACDNCPTAKNPRLDTLGLGLVQRDHDGDGRGDACDLCPHLKSTVPDTDADGDSIGTACDPNDGQRNAPAEFNGFYDPPVPAEWNVANNAGALADWELTQSADKRLWWRQKILDGGRHQIVRNQANIKEVYVDTTFRIHQVQPAMGANVVRGAAVSYGFLRQQNTDLYFNCGLRHDVQAVTTTTTSAAYGDDTPRTGEINEIAWTGDLTERDIRVVAMSTELDRSFGDKDSALSCAATADTTSLNTAATSELFPDGKVGLRTYGMTVSFDYLFIVNRARLQ